MDYSPHFSSAREKAAANELNSGFDTVADTGATDSRTVPSDRVAYFPPEPRDRSQSYPFFPDFGGVNHRPVREKAEPSARNGSTDKISKDELFFAFLDLPVSAWTSSRNH